MAARWKTACASPSRCTRRCARCGRTPSRSACASRPPTGSTAAGRRRKPSSSPRNSRSAACDYMDVSTGGLSPAQKIPLSAGYQVPFAEKVKKETGITTMSVGLIAGSQQAEDIVASGQGRPDLHRSRRDVGPALGLACGRGTRRRDALCAEDDGRPSEAAAAAVPEAGAAGGLSYRSCPRKRRTQAPIWLSDRRAGLRFRADEPDAT